MKKIKKMTIERQIVLMLIKRKRRNKKLLREAIKMKDESPCPGLETYIYARDADYSESHNASEFARRILYGYDEDEKIYTNFPNK
ncbi:hypothetical protein UFOVP459_40 [uncultured Caudovirales phage]|uniref:Uncharacterized protein n=1 Tax=uncultured Caudovirales phage TaxID=2100421 RepID=A0A6J5QL67_9CAUD|nr:hypothetical protein UFOVP459_40 [uncultured Caudovirales phage]CAB4183226.1 hypothetical protein UFOVP1089_45 [uncultured Caudovirales phage]CAB4213065.1 hypothetical protein UFOVP1443_64 [uncultured Caudovirales phage]